MPADFTEFYVIAGEPAGRAAGRAQTQRFLDRTDTPGPLSRARHFPTLEEAEAHLQALPKPQRAGLRIQFCTRPRRVRARSALQDLLDRVMAVPVPYRRTAYNWLRGRDVKALLLRESPDVYERHRKMLLEHDIDIERPSTVVLMKARRRKVTINLGTPPADGGPLHYLPPAGKR